MKKQLNILFVDDEQDFLETMVNRLNRRGHAAKSALTCEEAFRVAASGWPDVVVLDVMMPGKDGIQCLRELKQSWPDLTVIMLTGHASMQTGLNGLEFGASDYCLKPIELNELLEKIKIACREAGREEDKDPSLEPLRALAGRKAELAIRA